ncbi:hypothetical protein PIB30_049230 [Stylosanthes scabra]|uniref:Hexosyltransferase n=1 Tax=Stylosanthes scabra TaxID=79078 RepID=A0ABU6QHX2_9FABA|nr:hypothetical protein [Stylosanthes scabra]
MWKLETLSPALIAFKGHVQPIDLSWHMLDLGYQNNTDVENVKRDAVIHYNEEDPEEGPSEKEMHAIPRAMDMDADKDYLQYLEELRCHPEYSPIHSSQAFAQNPSDDTRSPSSDAHSQPNFDLSGVWPPLVGPSQ